MAAALCRRDHSGRRTPPPEPAATAILAAPILRDLERAARSMTTEDHTDAPRRVDSDFQANLSHELRTRLAGIIGYAELMLGESEATLAPVQRRHVSDMLTGARQMLQLVTDVLDL